MPLEMPGFGLLYGESEAIYVTDGVRWAEDYLFSDKLAPELKGIRGAGRR